MEEIIFRAKSLKNKKWVFGFYSQFHNRPVVNEPNSHQIFEVLEDEKAIRLFNTSIGGIWHIIDEKTLGQFTGKTDTGGTKIFEGDILLDYDEQVAGIVQWDDDEAGFGITLEGCWYNGECFSDLEVIGNIYDNPEIARDL
ncbi:hypothetical protein IKA92_07410 [bacterium]|nr:hypothetical protein [bacterium]MBR2387104.1 hypothetical protein [bacterium]